MSPYKGELHRIESHFDGRVIDELETIRAAVDRLTRHIGDLCKGEPFDPGLVSYVALTISDLCEMAYQREQEREQEQDNKQPQA